MHPVIYVDLRYLQDPLCRVRGIGNHVAALLRTRGQSSFSCWKTVGLLDPQMPQLPPEVASLVDGTTYSTNPCRADALAVFIDASPMTHNMRFALRFPNQPNFLRVAVVYDFIPLDWPGYFPALADRIEYLARLARLRKFDLFLPISSYTALRTSELLGVSCRQMGVTGASVRRIIYELRDRLKWKFSHSDNSAPYFVMVIGGDPRKNPEIAVKAVRRLNLAYGRRIALKIAGHYEDIHKRHLSRLAGYEQGAGFLEFCPGVSDGELVALYSGATATIVPAHIEGFSLPVVEAAVCGCPVVASTCAAHMELIEQQEALFPSDDAEILCEKLDALLNDQSLRDSLAAAQAHLGTKFHENAVGRRFWTAIEAAVESRRHAAVIAKPRKPTLAFLSPFPPDQSEAGIYTASTIRVGEKLFDSDLYTEAPRPLASEGRVRDAGGISLAPLLNGRYDGIISVIGNSPCNARIFEVFKQCGGPCILHDIPPFAESIIDRAFPLIVHSVAQQAKIKNWFGAEAQVLPCCPTALFTDEELTSYAKNTVRERHGIPPGTFLISSFGVTAPEKEMKACILAVELLRSWNIPAELFFIGNAGLYREEIDQLATWYGIAENVHCTSASLESATYRDFLVASDAAVQVQTHGLGQFSLGLADSISAGLPCVASDELAGGCDAPSYVARVPDRFSPLQVAEHLASIWETLALRDSHRDARATYLQTHNFDYYGRRLIEVLGIA